MYVPYSSTSAARTNDGSSDAIGSTAGSDTHHAGWYACSGRTRQPRGVPYFLSKWCTSGSSTVLVAPWCPSTCCRTHMAGRQCHPPNAAAAAAFAHGAVKSEWCVASCSVTALKK